MQAITYDDQEELQLSIREKPVPAQDEVLIKVRLAGICNTDMEITSGMLGFNGVLGHEFVGEVVQDNQDKLTGRRVVGEVNIPCYDCQRCKRRQFRHCANIKALGMRGKDGVLAEYVTLPRENVFLVPNEITDKEAVFVEPIAAAVEIAEQYHLKPSEKIAILGDGKLGLIIAMTLQALGLPVTVIGRHENKLAKLSSLAIETYLEKNIPADFQDIPVVIDATGSSSGLESALNLVRPEGKVIFKTTIANEININLAPLAINEVQLLGSRCGPFAPAIKLIKENNLPLGELITAQYPLKEGLKAFAKAREKDTLKVLVKP